MAAMSKFNLTMDDLCKGVMNLSSDVIKVMLTNTLPTATKHIYSDVSGTELANGNGYTTGGATVAGTGVSNSSGTESFAASATTFTSVTGSMGPFEYIIYYDSTPATKTLLGWYSYGSALTLNGANGDTLTLTPASSVLFTLA